MNRRRRRFMAPADADRCEADRQPLADGSGARCMHRKQKGSRYCAQHTRLPERRKHMTVETITAADFQLEDHGTVCLVRPLNDAASQWLDDNVASEGWQWIGDALACEPRLLPGLADGIEADGLTVQLL